MLIAKSLSVLTCKVYDFAHLHCKNPEDFTVKDRATGYQADVHHRKYGIVP